MALPKLRPGGWLPEGHHETTWDEIAERFGGEPGSPRAAVLSRLLAWRDAARQKGLAGRVILNGSFLSAKAEPGDFDLIFVYDERTEALVKRDKEAKALTGLLRCNERFGGDVFGMAITNVRRFPHLCRTDGFDQDKILRQPKGVVEVDL